MVSKSTFREPSLSSLPGNSRDTGKNWRIVKIKSRPTRGCLWKWSMWWCRIFQTDAYEPKSELTFSDGVINITAKTSRRIEPRYKSYGRLETLIKIYCRHFFRVVELNFFSPRIFRSLTNSHVIKNRAVPLLYVYCIRNIW